MFYISKYDSPIGGITLASNETELTGVWFDKQKFYADNLPKVCEEKELPVFTQTKKWLDIYFSGKNPDFTPHMPDKNNTNLAKTPIFSRFLPNSPSPVRQVRTKSPSTQIIKNSGVLVDSREKSLINSIFRRALRLIHRSFRGLYLYTNPRKRLALIARHA